MRKSFICCGVVLLALLTKAWILSGSPIVDANDDSREYINQILQPETEGVAYGPGTGWMGGLFLFLHLPFREAIETAFVVALVLVFRVFFGWLTRSYAAAGLFAFVLLDPTPTELFSHMMSDPIWMIETMIGLALFVLALDRQKQHWWMLALAALLLGLTTVTRSVFTPVMTVLAVFILAAVVEVLSKGLQKQVSLALLALSLWTLVLGTTVVYSATCWYNAQRFGYSGISALDCSEYKTFYMTLQSVGPSTGPPKFPIDERRRQLIAKAGPVSQWFVAEIEKNDYDKSIGLRRYGRYDLPAGWFHLATFNVLYSATHGNLRQTYRLMRNVEDEISEGGRRGVIPVRTILPLPDARWRIVASQLPQSLENAFSAITAEPPLDWLQQHAEHASTSDPDFTRALLREPALTTRGQEQFEWVLGAIYSRIYPPLTLIFFAVLPTAWFLHARSDMDAIDISFLTRQIFALFCVVLFFWYVLFDASGLPVLNRYMILHHVLTPLLLTFYLMEIWRLRRIGTIPTLDDQGFGTGSLR